MLKTILATLSAIVLTGMFAHAQTPTTPTATATTAPAPGAVKAERALVTTQLNAPGACQTEIARGNCAGEKVGEGLRKCIHKSGPLSAGCQQAMHTGAAEMKAVKGH